MFYWINDQSVINSVYHCGRFNLWPLLGLYSFGTITKCKSMTMGAIRRMFASPDLWLTSSAQFGGFGLWGTKFRFEVFDSEWAPEFDDCSASQKVIRVLNSIFWIPRMFSKLPESDHLPLLCFIL